MQRLHEGDQQISGLNQGEVVLKTVCLSFAILCRDGLQLMVAEGNYPVPMPGETPI